MPKRDALLLSPGFALAPQFANQIHAAHVRKGIGAPYISHLMAVSAQVLEYFGDEDQAIAALLHDAAEDCSGLPMLETVRVMFGNGVASIVECCTDTFEDPKPTWRRRKEAYIERMKHEPASARLVVTADKLHNLSNTLRDIRPQGGVTGGARPWPRPRTAQPTSSSGTTGPAAMPWPRAGRTPCGVLGDRCGIRASSGGSIMNVRAGDLAVVVKGLWPNVGRIVFVDRYFESQDFTSMGLGLGPGWRVHSWRLGPLQTVAGPRSVGYTPLGSLKPLAPLPLDQARLVQQQMAITDFKEAMQDLAKVLHRQDQAQRRRHARRGRCRRAPHIELADLFQALTSTAEFAPEPLVR